MFGWEVKQGEAELVKMTKSSRKPLWTITA